MNRKVSILIPCYNHEKYVAQCIASVLNQSFTDFELLITDDCSTDRSRSIIEQFDDPRITTFFFDKNRGAVGAFNFLVAKSKGEYIATLGSDDIWYPEKLQRQVACLDQHANLGACFSHAAFIDENGRTNPNSKRAHESIFFVQNRPQAQWMRLFFEDGNHLCHSSAMIRKSVHDQLGFYNPAYRQLHDMDMWIRLISQYPIQVIEEVLVGYRRVSASSISAYTSKNVTRHLNESCHILSQMIIGLNEDLLTGGFEDLFQKRNGILDCERFFVLSKYMPGGVHNLQPAITYLFSQNIAPLLLEHYDLRADDLYQYTGSEITYYPKSRKISNPLRLVLTLLRRERS